MNASVFKTLLLVPLLLFIGLGCNNSPAPVFPSSNMQLTSSAFKNNETIPSKYTCDGDNINPPLDIRDVPADAKSLALIVDDPDAPHGTWVHWTVWNIDPKTTIISENSVPPSVEGITDFGKPGYGGPCPPSGTHHYRFTLYALNTVLPTPSVGDKTIMRSIDESKIIATAALTGLYQRTK